MSPPRRIANAGEDTSAFLLSLDAMARLSCAQFRGPLWSPGPRRVGGMSGSPIIDKKGRAIGVVCTGSESENIKDYDGRTPTSFVPYCAGYAAAVANRTRRALGVL